MKEEQEKVGVGGESEGEKKAGRGERKERRRIKREENREEEGEEKKKAAEESGPALRASSRLPNSGRPAAFADRPLATQLRGRQGADPASTIAASGQPRAPPPLPARPRAPGMRSGRRRR